MNRRRMISISFGASGLVLLGGCIPLAGLLRFGVRGSMIRNGARAARLSKRGNLHTFGRGAASHLHLMQIVRTIYAVEQLSTISEVFGVESDDSAVKIVAKGDIAECSVDGVVVSTTSRQGRVWEHHSVLVGASGTSIATGEREIKHWDSTGQLVGADVWVKGAIQHFDRDGGLVGRTPFSAVRGEKVTVARVGEKGYLDLQMANLARDHKEAFAGNLQDLNAIANSQADCLRRAISENCLDQRVTADNALQRLEHRFRSFA